MRAFFKYTLAVFAVLVLIPGLGLLSSSLLIGNVEAVTGTVDLVLDSSSARQAMGEVFAQHLIDNANPQEVASLKASKSELADAAAQGIQDQAKAVSAAVGTGYTAFIHDSNATVDLAPMLQSIQARMHAVNPAVPARADVSNATITLKSNSGGGAILIIFTVGVSWFVIALGLLLLLGVALLSRARGMRKALIPGICLVIVGAWWLVLGATLPGGVSKAVDDPSAANIARSVADIVTRQFEIIGAIALGIGAVLVFLALIIGSKARPRVPNPASTPLGQAPS